MTKQRPTRRMHNASLDASTVHKEYTRFFKNAERVGRG